MNSNPKKRVDLHYKLFNKIIQELCDNCFEDWKFYNEYRIKPFVPCDRCLRKNFWIKYREKSKFNLICF